MQLNIKKPWLPFAHVNSFDASGKPAAHTSHKQTPISSKEDPCPPRHCSLSAAPWCAPWVSVPHLGKPLRFHIGHQAPPHPQRRSPVPGCTYAPGRPPALQATRRNADSGWRLTWLAADGLAQFFR